MGYEGCSSSQQFVASQRRNIVTRSSGNELALIRESDESNEQEEVDSEQYEDEQIKYTLTHINPTKKKPSHVADTSAVGPTKKIQKNIFFSKNNYSDSLPHHMMM